MFALICILNLRQLSTQRAQSRISSVHAAASTCRQRASNGACSSTRVSKRPLPSPPPEIASRLASQSAHGEPNWGSNDVTVCWRFKALYPVANETVKLHLTQHKTHPNPVHPSRPLSSRIEVSSFPVWLLSRRVWSLCTQKRRRATRSSGLREGGRLGRMSFQEVQIATFVFSFRRRFYPSLQPH